MAKRRELILQEIKLIVYLADMRMTIFVLFLTLLHLGGYAQKSDTAIRYFNSRFEPVQKNTAVYIGKSFPVNNKWGVQVMDDSSRVLLAGTYKDKSLKIKDGPFTFYYPSGKQSIQGNFVSNEQSDLWMSWYPSGQKKDSVLFYKGAKHGSSYSWFENGRIESIGTNRMGYADGDWTWFHENGQTATKENYAIGKLKSLECFDSLGNNTGITCSLEKVPTIKGYYGGINKYIIDSLYYPEEALKKNIQGMVDVNFTISKEGKLTQVKILNSPSSLLSNEVIRVLYSVKTWYPAISHNRIVDFTVSLNIPFYKPGNVPFNEAPGMLENN